MSSIIATGNEIGKSMALINLMVAVCMATSSSAFSTFLIVKNPKDSKGETKNNVRAATVFCMVGIIAILIAGIRYTLIDKVKGLGALNTALTLKRIF
jgi:uncharacterized membrane protein